MSGKIFLATQRLGLARAMPDKDGAWRVDHLLPERDFRCLATDPMQPGVIYAGTQGDGVWRSDDRGATWQQAGLQDQVVKALAASPHQPGVVYAGIKPALVYVSDDGGTSWRELEGFRNIPGRETWTSPAEPPYIGYVKSLALSPTDPGVILAGIEAAAVVRSVDGGTTWSQHRPDAVRDCHQIMFHPQDGAWAYEGGGTGAAISRDAGETWMQPRDGLDRSYCWAVAAAPDDPQLWYVSASPSPGMAHSDTRSAEAYIYRRRGNEPWQRLAGGLPQPLTSMPYVLLTDPDAPGHLYAGLRSGEIWHSTDRGETWQQLPLHLPSIDQEMLLL